MLQSSCAVLKPEDTAGTIQITVSETLSDFTEILRGQNRALRTETKSDIT